MQTIPIIMNFGMDEKIYCDDHVWNLRDVRWKTFILEMKNWTSILMLTSDTCYTGWPSNHSMGAGQRSVAHSLQFVYDPDKNSNSDLFKHIIQPKSQFPDLIFSGELQHGLHGITFWMPLYLCNLRFWSCKWDPLYLRDFMTYLANIIISSSRRNWLYWTKSDGVFTIDLHTTVCKSIVFTEIQIIISYSFIFLNNIEIHSPNNIQIDSVTMV